MTEAQYERLFAGFVKDHPEYANARPVVEFSTGRERGITLEATEAFARWCLFNGHGDPQQVLALLTEMPDIKRRFDQLERSGPNWGGGRGSVLG